MPDDPKPVQEIAFLGGRLCLDFVNTANWDDDGTARDERLGSLADVAVWLSRQGLVPPDFEVAGARPGLLEELLTLRAALRRLLLKPELAGASDLARLNAARQGPAPALERRGGRLGLAPAAELDWLPGELARSAGECLLGVDPKRIKACPGERCGWVFLDESPNNRRRWCSMASCGNRDKARRHYRRRRGAGD